MINDNPTGLIPDLMALLGEAGNFTYTWTLQSDGVYGTQRPDGSWSGMVGQLTLKVRIFRSIRLLLAVQNCTHSPTTII